MRLMLEVFAGGVLAVIGLFCGMRAADGDQTERDVVVRHLARENYELQLELMRERSRSVDLEMKLFQGGKQ